jgi:CxxC motif-containing protein
MCTIIVVQWTQCECLIQDAITKCQEDVVDPYHCPRGTQWADEPIKKNGHCGCLA